MEEWPDFYTAWVSDNTERIFNGTIDRDFGGLESNLFESSELASNFECSICLCVAVDPFHHVQPRCGALFCEKCLLNHRNIRQDAACPLCGVKLSNMVEPAKPQILRILENLIRTCQKGCGFNGKNNDVRRHENLCVQNAENVNFVAEERKEEEEGIEELKEKIRKLEEEISQKEEIDFRKKGTVGFSNHIKHAGPNDDQTTLNIAVTPLANISMLVQRDQHVIDVRRQLAQQLNKPLESVRLINFVHRELLDGEVIRQHGIGGRDHHLILLPENREFPPGMAVKIKIIGTRPAVPNLVGPRDKGSFRTIGTQHIRDRGRSLVYPGDM